MRNFVTVREFAAIIRCSESSVWRWTKSGELPVRRFGRSVRIPLDEALQTKTPDVKERALQILASRRIIVNPCLRCLRQTAVKDDMCHDCIKEEFEINERRRLAELEKKRKWWDANGNEWRKRRKEDLTNVG